MQKIVALLTGLTKTHAIKKTITFTFASFFILLVSCFYTLGVGAGRILFNAVTQLIKQNPNLEILALFWGMTQTLWILGIFCLGLAIVEYFSQKTTQPRWVNTVLKPNAYLKWMVEMLYWSAIILLMVGFTVRNLGLDVSQIQLFAVNVNLPSPLIFFLSLGQAALVSSGLLALLGVMDNLPALKKPVKKA
ncbi:hypothetical protein WH390_15895 (plasmid) [Candidatus Arsenophonus nilaparvatae]|uniref:hypothetical protein n=1 Tax=Candidatus Arsenophonus nilaparvatae TaxID=1247023 RepID=UPI00387841C8